MDPITDRGPAPSFYDAPREPDMIECGACAGEGYMGCTLECFKVIGKVTGIRMRDRICLENHACLQCKGEGALPMTPEMDRDAKGAADEARWDCAREDRMGEDKQEEGI